MTEYTEQEVLDIVSKFENKDERNKIICAMIGHSKIIDTFFGYIRCARCETLLGDALTGVFDGSKYVIVGHNCSQCKDNYKDLTWKDLLFAPYPFTKEEDE